MLSLPVFVGIIYVCIGMVIAFVVTFIMVQVLGVGDLSGEVLEENKANAEDNPKSKKASKIITQVVKSPLAGKAKDLKSLNNGVFSEGLMGKGIVIIPTNNEVTAPVSGTVEVIASTSHAIGLKTDDGVEVLIHMGIDTVELQGKHFKVLVKKGDVVKQGQKIAEVDFNAIKKDGYSSACPVIVTNTNNFKNVVSLVDNQSIKNGENILDIVR